MNSRDLGADYVFAWPRRAARRHGRQAGRRRSSTGATSRPPTTPRPRATSSPPTTPTSTSSAGTAAAEGYVDEVIRPGDTRRRLAEALTTLDAIAHPAQGVQEHPAMTPAITDTSWSAPFEALEAGQAFTTRGRTVTEADVVGFAGAHRRLAPAAHGRRVGRRAAVRRADRPRDARRLAARPGSSRSTPSAWSRCARVARRRRSSARCGSATRSTSRARIAELDAGRRGRRPGRRSPGTSSTRTSASSAARASRCCGGATARPSEPTAREPSTASSRSRC